MKFSKPSFKAVLGGTVAAYCLCLLSATAVQAADQDDEKSAVLNNHSRTALVNSHSVGQQNHVALLSVQDTPALAGPEAMTDDLFAAAQLSAQNTSRDFLEGMLLNDSDAVYNNSLDRLTFVKGASAAPSTKSIYSKVLSDNQAFLDYADRNSGFKSLDYVASGSATADATALSSDSKVSLYQGLSLNDKVEMVLYKVQFRNNAKAYVVVPTRAVSKDATDGVAYGVQSALTFCPQSQCNDLVNNKLIASAFGHEFLDKEFNPEL